MVLKELEYKDKAKNKKIIVKKVSPFSTGLMFKQKSLPLMFELRKESKIAFTSIFCKKFYMIVLDKDKNVVDKIFFNRWKSRVYVRGKYFIEILEELDDVSSNYRNI